MKQTLTSIPAAPRLRTVILLLLLCVVLQLQATVLYVKQSGTGDGSSWANASADLQAMINASGADDQVWVAAGIYKPTAYPTGCGSCGTTRNYTFHVKDGVKIYGGFFGNQNNPPARQIPAHNTILSGDIGIEGVNTDNVFHVVLASAPSSGGIGVTIDGFTISGGNADGSVSITVNGNDIIRNRGGGIYTYGGTNTLTNNTLTGNTADYGGGIVADFSNNTLTNNTLAGNIASILGGGIYTGGGTNTLSNNIFWGNTKGTNAAIQGADYYRSSGANTFTNNLLQLASSNYTTTGGSGSYDLGTAASGNLFAQDPLFVDAATGNLRFQACSPAIDAGTNTGAPATDLDGNARVDAITGGSNVDMGAYEYQGDLDVDDDGYAYCGGIDCNDNNFNINPSAAEICDGVDNNCAGGVDEGNVCCPAGGILYVNDDASGLNNGSSWTDAFTSLQSALASTCPGVTQIWVAAGTYEPTTCTTCTTADRNISFSMKNGVAIYGGFDGTETMLNERDWVSNVTTLSGDIDGGGTLANNSIHVIFNNNGLNNTAILDGFTVTGGNANDFHNSLGGGMYNNSSSPNVTNCIFSGNSANSGGGMYNNAYSPSVTNCTFSGNSANFGGGMYNSCSSPSVTNCILWNNGSEIFNSNSSPTVTYSIVQGGYTPCNNCPNGNGNTDPLFVSATDLRLQSCSPAIDAGTDSGAPTNDLDGNLRPHDAAPNVPGNFDMGAYEYQGTTTAPVAACQNITVQLDANHTVSVTGSQVNEGSSGCGTLSFLLNGQTSLSFDCDDVGIPQSVTITVTDYFANTATCQATITVADDGNLCCAPADAVCQNATVQLDENGEATLLVGNVDGGSTYECGLDEMTVSPSAFDCSHVGAPQSVTLTVTDINGESDNCTAEVTVEDHVAPVALCVESITVQLDASGEASLAASDLDSGSSDNCSTVTFTMMAPPPPPPSPGTPPGTPNPPMPPPVAPVVGEMDLVIFGCQHVSNGYHNYYYKLIVTDEEGNSSNCFTLVTVEDNIAPTALCHDITVQLDENGEATITPEDVDGDGEETSFDNCGITSISLDITSFTCANVGQENSVELTVTDVNGNENTCTATVTVVDEVAPVAACQENVTVQLDENGLGSLSASVLDNGSSDACGNLTFAMKKSSGHGVHNHPRPAVNYNCGFVGEHLYTLVVKDESGNSSTCTATVTVEDNLQPTALCHDLTVQLDENGEANITPEDVFDSGSDNCGTVNLQGVSPSSFTCTNLGGNQVTLTVNDGHGNTNTCTATVTVQDNMQPSAVCKNHTVALNASGTASIAPADVFDSGTDNCGTVNPQGVSPSSFTCANLGGNQVILTVNDGNGNTNTCEATVTVQDNTAPTITCPAPITVNNDEGECSAVVTYTVSGSDNCDFSLSQTGGLASGQPFPAGVTTNTWNVTDAANNSATCSFTVTVNKTGDPGLLYAYTVIGFDEVKMKANTVQSGGVGVVNAGKKAKLEQNTMVTAANTFVKAPVLDLNGGSLVTTYHPGQVDINLLPVFQPNTAPCNNNLNIPDNSGPVTLSLACYGDVTVGKNVSVAFSSNPTVTVKELKLKEGSAVYFSQSTNLLIDKKLDADKYVDISNNGHSVWIFVEEDVKIDDGSSVAANVYTQKHLKVDKTSSGNPTYMTGLFIAEKVDSKDNVFWNWDASGCPSSPPPMLMASVTQFNAVGQVINGTPQVDLSWVTDQDAHNDFYEVEKTLDGITFEPVLEQNSRQNERAQVYQGLDPTADEGVWLYRLKVTRRDGTVDYSELKRVIIELPNGYTLFPNPAGNQVNLSLKGHEGKAALLQIVNSQGVVVGQREVESLPAEPLSFDLHNYRDGMYYLNVRVEGKRSRAMRFVVVKN